MAQQALKAVHVAIVERGDVVAIQIKNAPASTGLVQTGNDQFGSIARVAGDVVCPELSDIPNDQRPAR